MKKIIFTLLFSTLVFSSPSFAKWIEVGKTVKGDTFYVDLERIRKHEGYVYYWMLNDLLKPQLGDLSIKYYRQVDCQLFRFKTLSYSFHKQPMGDGTGEVLPSTGVQKNWNYPSPDSMNESTLKKVCSN